MEIIFFLLSVWTVALSLPNLISVRLLVTYIYSIPSPDIWNALLGHLY